MLLQHQISEYNLNQQNLYILNYLTIHLVKPNEVLLDIEKQLKISNIYLVKRNVIFQVYQVKIIKQQ